MGKKLLMLAASLALLAIGIVAGVKFSGDNRATVVGDTSRYTAATSSAGQLTRSVGGSGVTVFLAVPICVISLEKYIKIEIVKTKLLSLL